MTNEEFLKDVCPNHTEQSKWNRNELLHILELYEKQLRIGGVGSGFFTDSDVGKEFEIIANTNEHGFNIGEIVTLLDLDDDEYKSPFKDDDEYKFAGKDDYWWCKFADVKAK